MIYSAHKWQVSVKSWGNLVPTSQIPLIEPIYWSKQPHLNKKMYPFCHLQSLTFCKNKKPSIKTLWNHLISAQIRTRKTVKKILETLMKVRNRKGPCLKKEIREDRSGPAEVLMLLGNFQVMDWNKQQVDRSLKTTQFITSDHQLSSTWYLVTPKILNPSQIKLQAVVQTKK